MAPCAPQEGLRAFTFIIKMHCFSHVKFTVFFLRHWQFRVSGALLLQDHDIAGECMQVIYMVWSVMPPSTWFSPDKPQRFAAVACLVLALSAGLAWLQNRFWKAVTAAAARGTFKRSLKGAATSGKQRVDVLATSATMHVGLRAH
jgi:hypothetical protein